MASGFQNIGKIPELRRRIFYTLALLAVYRIGVFVTTPGVNRAIMAKIVNQASGTFLGLFNMFSGGALEQMSIFALGIMPYISASIILQLLTVVVPKLEQAPEGRRAGPPADQPVHALRLRHPVADPGVLHRALARVEQPRLRAVRRRSCVNPGWGFRCSR